MLGCYLASPTVVGLAGEPYLVARLRLGDFGLLLSEGAIALGRDPDSRDIPGWGDDGFYDWLTGDGVALFLWCVLRRDRPGLTIADCATIASRAAAREVADAYRAAMRRSTTGIAGAGAREDIAALRWGRTVKLLRAGHGYAAISDLTLDQVDLEGTRADAADPEADAQDRAVLDDMQRQHAELWAAREAERPRTVEEDLAEMGLSVVPEEADEPG